MHREIGLIWDSHLQQADTANQRWLEDTQDLVLELESVAGAAKASGDIRTSTTTWHEVSDKHQVRTAQYHLMFADATN